MPATVGHERPYHASSSPGGTRCEVLVGWGDRVLPEAPPFDVRRQTPQAAASQFGYGCDWVALVPVTGRKAVLVATHQHTDASPMFPGDLHDDATRARISMAAHGISVVTVKRGRESGKLSMVKPSRASLNRRVHANTIFKVTGPAAGDERLRTTADPTGRRVRGTVSTGGATPTPWGTVLMGEGPLGGYFDACRPVDAAYAETCARYGLDGSGRGWGSVDPRFDLSAEPHEAHRFGWVVDVDPARPLAKPRKFTMLGRLAHRGLHVMVSPDGRVVVHLGDSDRDDRLFRFVSRDRVSRLESVRARKHNRNLLNAGTLSVARLAGDGTDEWIPLTSDTTSYVAGMSVADVLIDTRRAAETAAPETLARGHSALRPQPPDHDPARWIPAWEAGRGLVTCADTAAYAGHREVPRPGVCVVSQTAKPPHSG